jgi:phenylpyruvate tautomerase PptA (4-oxalocrotonate tautomerase family)
MPLYTITTQAGVLDSPAKADLADKLTAFHGEYAGVPKNWVHVVFHEYPIGSLWSLVQAATGAADEEIVLGIQEVPSSQAMEMGQIMPDVASY